MDGLTRPATVFFFIGPDYAIADVIGDSRQLYPELPAAKAGDDLKAFIAARIDAGYVGLNETLNIKTRSPLGTRLLELDSYPLFKTHQFTPQGQVLALTHSRLAEQSTLIAVSATPHRIELDAADRFHRSASLLEFDVTASGKSGFGLIEHIAYSIINTMAVPLMVLNGDGVMLAANEAAQRVFQQGLVSVDRRDQLQLAEGRTQQVLAHLSTIALGAVVPLPQFARLGLRYARAITTPPLGKIFVLALDDQADSAAQAELLRQRHPALTASEAEIGLLLLAGTSPKRIAQDRDASIHTVRTQIASILKKTNCHSVASFIAISRVFIF